MLRALHPAVLSFAKFALVIKRAYARDKKGLRSREKRFTFTSVSLAGGARAATKEDERA